MALMAEQPGSSRDEAKVSAVSARGRNQSDMRAHNERLILSLIRRHGELSKTEVSRLSGLSAQTTSVIMRTLEAGNLVKRGTPVRGQIGQPSVPMSINPEGAFFYGLSLGRRNTELILTDLTGQVRETIQQEYEYPTPAGAISFVRSGIKSINAKLNRTERHRISGLGIAIPFDLWAWTDRAGVPATVYEAWRDADIQKELSKWLKIPIYAQNDATAACGAELFLGPPREAQDILYFFVGWFVGGGIVLGGSLYNGRSGNAGALGSVLVPYRDGSVGQLLQVASLSLLEKALNQRDIDSSVFWTSPESWGEIENKTGEWLAQAADGLAHAIVSACSVIDFELVVIDGWLPNTVREKLVLATNARLNAVVSDGLRLPPVTAGSVGVHATAIGAACLALRKRFMIN